MRVLRKLSSCTLDLAMVEIFDLVLAKARSNSQTIQFSYYLVKDKRHRVVNIFYYLGLTTRYVKFELDRTTDKKHRAHVAGRGPQQP